MQSTSAAVVPALPPRWHRYTSSNIRTTSVSGTSVRSPVRRSRSSAYPSVGGGRPRRAGDADQLGVGEFHARRDLRAVVDKHPQAGLDQRGAERQRCLRGETNAIADGAELLRELLQSRAQRQDQASVLGVTLAVSDLSSEGLQALFESGEARGAKTPPPPRSAARCPRAATGGDRRPSPASAPRRRAASRDDSSTACCHGTSASCTPCRMRTGQPVSISPPSRRCLRPSSIRRG